MTATRQSTADQGLPARLALSLLFLVPGVTLALTYGIVAATFGSGSAAVGVMIFAPPIATAAINYAVCWRRAVHAANVSVFVLAPVLVATIAAFALSLTFVQFE